MKNLLFSFLLFLVFGSSIIHAQVSIGTTGSLPDPSAMLDVQSSNKGLLVPRLNTLQRTSISSPASGLMVYDNDLKTFCFYNGNAWAILQSSNNSWSLSGNTIGNTEFIGSVNNQSLLFKANNQQAGKIDLPLFNTFWGSGAGSSITTGLSNTAVGQDALHYNSAGHDNTAQGLNTLFMNTVGFNNVAVGTAALYSNTSGAANTAIGINALFTNTTGYSNTAVGISALSLNTTGYSNIAIGTGALLSNTMGFYNTAVGENALHANTTGAVNTSIGFNTLYNNTTGSHNTAVGMVTMFSNTTGYDNTGVGRWSLYANTTGYYNTAIGLNSLFSNTVGYDNTSSGRDALFSNTTGYDNVANGANALHDNVTGKYNTAVGEGALLGALNSWNTGVGANTGTNANNSTYCLYMGYDADNNLPSNSYTSSIAIGNASRITASNQVRIGNSSAISIGGYQGWSNISDGRFKKGVQENVPGLAFITRLRPVTYHLDIEGIAEKLNEDGNDSRNENERGERNENIIQARQQKSRQLETGFIAQEVETVANELGYEFSGIDKPEEADGLYALRYAEFVVPLVKAVQEQQSMIQAQNKKIESLNQEIYKIHDALEKLFVKTAFLELNTN